MGRKGMDLTDHVFDRLVVLHEVPTTVKGVRKWHCKCQCGKETDVFQSSLRAGATTSCGCKAKEVTSARMYKDGRRGTRLYSIWHNMRRRCGAPKATGYEHYGGRGISVCSEWQDSFESFQSWALANGYTEELTIDRINNGGNYEPSNCRWATLHEQGLNKRRSTKFASKYKHVTWDNANSKWRAFSKGVCGGRYEHEDNAAKAAQELFD